jgi:hypothetical protein
MPTFTQLLAQATGQGIGSSFLSHASATYQLAFFVFVFVLEFELRVLCC